MTHSSTGARESAADPHRRQLISAAAWSIPVVVLATSTPATAASVAPGTVIVDEVSWDPSTGNGFAYLLVTSGVFPTLSNSYVTFDDPAVSLTGFRGVGHDLILLEVATSIPNSPAQFTAMVSIPDFVPLDVTFQS